MDNKGSPFPNPPLANQHARRRFHYGFLSFCIPLVLLISGVTLVIVSVSDYSVFHTRLAGAQAAEAAVARSVGATNNGDRYYHLRPDDRTVGRYADRFPDVPALQEQNVGEGEKEKVPDLDYQKKLEASLAKITGGGHVQERDVEYGDTSVDDEKDVTEEEEGKDLGDMWTPETKGKPGHHARQLVVPPYGAPKDLKGLHSRQNIPLPTPPEEPPKGTGGYQYDLADAPRPAAPKEAPQGTGGYQYDLADGPRPVAPKDAEASQDEKHTIHPRQWKNLPLPPKKPHFPPGYAPLPTPPENTLPINPSPPGNFTTEERRTVDDHDGGKTEAVGGGQDDIEEEEDEEQRQARKEAEERLFRAILPPMLAPLPGPPRPSLPDFLRVPRRVLQVLKEAVDRTAAGAAVPDEVRVVLDLLSKLLGNLIGGIPVPSLPPLLPTSVPGLPLPTLPLPTLPLPTLPLPTTQPLSRTRPLPTLPLPLPTLPLPLPSPQGEVEEDGQTPGKSTGLLDGMWSGFAIKVRQASPTSPNTTVIATTGTVAAFATATEAVETTTTTMKVDDEKEDEEVEEMLERAGDIGGSLTPKQRALLMKVARKQIKAAIEKQRDPDDPLWDVEVNMPACMAVFRHLVSYAVTAGDMTWVKVN